MAATEYSMMALPTPVRARGASDDVIDKDESELLAEEEREFQVAPASVDLNMPAAVTPRRYRRLTPPVALAAYMVSVWVG